VAAPTTASPTTAAPTTATPSLRLSLTNNFGTQDLIFRVIRAHQSAEMVHCMAKTSQRSGQSDIAVYEVGLDGNTRRIPEDVMIGPLVIFTNAGTQPSLVVRSDAFPSPDERLAASRAHLHGLLEVLVRFQDTLHSQNGMISICHGQERSCNKNHVSWADLFCTNAYTFHGELYPPYTSLPGQTANGRFSPYYCGTYHLSG